ncbi:MAG: HAMP domain-containing histidine kinase [Sandaracinaceae bacterium]|nr:HAMP domain-containing histidine kinase [Sandaracinaceae bacterium]
MQDSVEAVGLTWLIRLRWLTLAAQGLALGTAWWQDLAEPGVGLALLGGFAASNVALSVMRPRLERGPTVSVVLVADVVLLTALLHLTGGPMNPFTALYFVYITLAAVMPSTRTVLVVLALSLVGYAVLFLLADEADHHRAHVHLEAHLRGMWIAFGVAAGLIAVFVARLASALARRERELAGERARTERSARVLALTSLAAGAAHELGTPIGTIVIAAGELERALEGRDVGEEILEDVRLIRGEGLRCREILEGLGAAGGVVRGEGLASVRLGDVVDRALERLGPDRARVVVEGAADEEARLPPMALTLALRNLLRNALDASAPGEGVHLSVAADATSARFEVADHGAGMSPEIARQATEPFFTTKGEGMGLGLFLARAVAEQLGGELVLDSKLGAGTVARLRFPRTLGGAA